MMTMLKNWNGAVEVNGIKYDNIAKVLLANFKPNEAIHITLYPEGFKAENKADNAVVANNKPKEYRITVKAYMTKKASPEFDFMAKWNNDVPMPYRTMTGVKVKETRGMVYMKLHGDIWAERITTCMCCGRTLTNPVSQYFGIGPECGGHNYVNPFEDDEQLKEAVNTMKKQLINVTWEGWVIKSAITEEVEV